MKMNWKLIILFIIGIVITLSAGIAIGTGLSNATHNEEVIEYTYISPNQVYKNTYKNNVHIKQERLYSTKEVKNKDGTKTFYLNDGARIIWSKNYIEVIYPDKSQTESYWNTDIKNKVYPFSLDSIWKSVFG